jgi:hypothetical protein
LQVEWDLNGDGIYDTPLTTSKILTNRFAVAGDWLVRARLTDPAGSQTISAPIAVRVLAPPTLSIVRSGNQIRVGWSTNATGFVLESTPALIAANWQPVAQVSAVLAGSNYVTFTNPPTNAYLRLKK